MNETINKLIYESGLVAQGCWDKFDEYDRRALEKFAELIVQECAGVADDPDTDMLRVGKTIREHFGVEK